MNFVFLSPGFPPNYRFFCDRLKAEGALVLGIGDAPFSGLHPELRETLAWYYQADMRDMDALRAAMRFFTERFGRVDRLDSLNEYWLENEAALRTEFGVPGVQVSGIPAIRRKSGMKKVFDRAGVPRSRGGLIPDPASARELAASLGFPVVVKPDGGMGAEFTYRLDSPGDLERFLSRKPDRDFIMEEFIEGEIVTFDGLADRDGKIVFCTSHLYGQGVMEAVLADMHISYYSLREIPGDIETAGRKLAAAFEVRERFFHFEFFRRKDGSLCALEVNMRPPGGMTLDMFNFACDLDIYSVWAAMMARGSDGPRYARKYYCGYAGRKSRLRYAYSIDDIAGRLGDGLVHCGEMPPVIARAMGETGFLVRCREEEGIRAAMRMIHELA